MNRRKIVLSVNKDYVAENIVFGEIKKPVTQPNGNSGEAYPGFLFLIAISYLKFLDQKEANKVSSHPQSARLISKLYEVIRHRNEDKNRFTEYFGEVPRGTYVETWTKSGAKFVEFNQNVTPVIEFEVDPYSSETIVEKVVKFIGGLLGLEGCSRSTLVNLSESLTNQYVSRATSIEIIGTRKRVIPLHFTNWNRNHSFLRKDLFGIRIRSNHSVNFCVFWIDSEGNCYDLHPTVDERLQKQGVNTAKATPLGMGGRELLLPSNRLLKIDSKQGTETCVVVSSEEEFDLSKIKKLKARFKALSEKSEFCGCVQEEDYEELVLEEEILPSQAGDFELGVADGPNDWIDSLQHEAHGFGKFIRIWSIPHSPMP